MQKIKSASIEMVSSIVTKSDGDPWPCAWGDDGFLYTANGDGKGFDLGSEWTDIVVNRISGDAMNLAGERLTGAEGVGGVFADPQRYNRKPTGMACAHGNLYLCVQNLNKVPGKGIFDDAPCCTICLSRDKGKTWEFDRNKPMFSNWEFTTIFFADFGRNNEYSPGGYLYAYGMDYNWRSSFSGSVTNPDSLFLARVLPESALRREEWEFYGGMRDGLPVFTKRFEERRPVLCDSRLVEVKPPEDLSQETVKMNVISQGSVVYNAPLKKLIYSSWTENTFEFYEAEHPWGPFIPFLSQSFGHYPWNENCYGGYATVIPSKFISEDGKTMYIVSATFAGGVKRYGFHLRKLRVEI